MTANRPWQAGLFRLPYSAFVQELALLTRCRPSRTVCCAGPAPGTEADLPQPAPSRSACRSLMMASKRASARHGQGHRAGPGRRHLSQRPPASRSSADDPGLSSPPPAGGPSPRSRRRAAPARVQHLALTTTGSCRKQAPRLAQSASPPCSRAMERRHREAERPCPCPRSRGEEGLKPDASRPRDGCLGCRTCSHYRGRAAAVRVRSGREPGRDRDAAAHRRVPVSARWH